MLRWEENGLSLFKARLSHETFIKMMIIKPIKAIRILRIIALCDEVG